MPCPYTYLCRSKTVLNASRKAATSSLEITVDRPPTRFDAIKTPSFIIPKKTWLRRAELFPATSR